MKRRAKWIAVGCLGAATWLMAGAASAEGNAKGGRAIGKDVTVAPAPSDDPASADRESKAPGVVQPVPAGADSGKAKTLAPVASPSEPRHAGSECRLSIALAEPASPRRLPEHAGPAWTQLGIAAAALLLAALALGVAFATQRRLANQPRGAITAPIDPRYDELGRLQEQLSQIGERLTGLLELTNRVLVEPVDAPGRRSVDGNSLVKIAPRNYDPAEQHELLRALIRAFDAHGGETSTGSHLEVDVDRIQFAGAHGAHADLTARLSHLNLIAPAAKQRALREQNFLSVVAVRAGADNQPRRVVRLHKDAMAGLRSLLEARA